MPMLNVNIGMSKKVSSLSDEMITRPERTMIATTVERSSRTLYKRRWNAFPKLDWDDDDDDAITGHHRSLTMVTSLTTRREKHKCVMSSTQPNAPMGSRFVVAQHYTTRNVISESNEHELHMLALAYVLRVCVAVCHAGAAGTVTTVTVSVAVAHAEAGRLERGM